MLYLQFYQAADTVFLFTSGRWGARIFLSIRVNCRHVRHGHVLLICVWPHLTVTFFLAFFFKSLAPAVSPVLHSSLPVNCHCCRVFYVHLWCSAHIEVSFLPCLPTEQCGWCSDCFSRWFLFMIFLKGAFFRLWPHIRTGCSEHFIRFVEHI